MGVVAAHIGFGHEAGDGLGVLWRRAGGDKGAADEGGKAVGGNAQA